MKSEKKKPNPIKRAGKRGSNVGEGGQLESSAGIDSTLTPFAHQL